MNTVKDSWDSYKTQVLPEDAGKIQLIETRRAFYAGWVGALALLGGLPDKDYSDQAMDAIADGLERELAQFNKMVGTAAELENL